MKRTGFLLLAASSLLLTVTASAANRPHYGGTLHVAMRAASSSLDPATASEVDWTGSPGLFGLIFDSLVTLDSRGRARPGLAASWQGEPGNQRWRFLLRRDVSWSDGTTLTPDTIAASLRAANPTWKVFSSGDALIIERDAAAPDLPAELALQRNRIARRDGVKLAGTGPFVVSQWDPGKKLVLIAREDYWDGRAFLDSIEIEMGKSFRDQMISFDLGKNQLIEIAPEEARRAAAEGLRIENSQPMELMALVFTGAQPSADDEHLRLALALSIDRQLLNSVVLQGNGEPAGGLLPNWMTGYEPVFPVHLDMTRAQEERAEVSKTNLWNLALDNNDPLERVIAERIVLSAHDAGLRLQIATGDAADVRIVRIPLASLDAHIALTELAVAIGLPRPAFADSSTESLYAAENGLLQSHRVIPLLQVRASHAISATVMNWGDAGGGWEMPNLWLAPEKP
jgi:ABC-type transport system substrate-binding protein